jgi:hypothetical protein
MKEQEMLRVQAVVEVPAAALRAVVENGKRMAGPDEKGHYRVDTAELLAVMISRFLLEKGFAAWVRDPKSYPEEVP